MHQSSHSRRLLVSRRISVFLMVYTPMQYQLFHIILLLLYITMFIVVVITVRLF